MVNFVGINFSWILLGFFYMHDMEFVVSSHAKLIQLGSIAVSFGDKKPPFNLFRL